MFRKIAAVGTALSLLHGGAASAQETILTGLITEAAPGARLTWETGLAEAGVETYQDLFLSINGVRARAERVQVSAEGPVALLTAEGVLVNLDGEEGFALGFSRLTLTGERAHLRLIRNPNEIAEICASGADKMTLTLEGPQLARSVDLPQGRSGQSISRLGSLSGSFQLDRSGGRCVGLIRVEGAGFQEARSDKSGSRIDRFAFDLSGPSDLMTLISPTAPDLTLSGSAGGAERLLPGGAPGLAFRDGDFDLQVRAASLVPALTAYLRTRELPSPDRFTEIGRALRPANGSGDVHLNGVVLLAEALLPAAVASNLSRASLTNIIGDYDLSGTTSGGEFRLHAGSDIVGVGRSAVELTGAVEAPKQGEPELTQEAHLLDKLPRIRADQLRLTHQDAGLLRAVEQVTGFPISEYTAVFLKEGLDGMPERWRPAVIRIATELTRFLLLSGAEQGAEMVLLPAPDLSLQEVVQILTLRPDLSGELIRSEIGRASAPAE